MRIGLARDVRRILLGRDEAMTDPKAIDISPEAVAKRIVRLESLAERGWIDGDIVDLVSALSAALREARGKVDELEALREQQAAAFVKFAKDRPVAPHPVDQMENLRRAMTTDIEIEKLEAERDSLRSKLAEAERERDEAKNNILAWSDAHADMEASRDAALSELAKLRAEAEWRLISEAPQKASLFGSDVLLANSKQVTVGHPTRFDKDKFTMMSGKYAPPTHFRPLPSPPKDPAHD